MNRSELAKKYRIEDGDGFSLADIKPGDTGGVDVSKGDAKELLEKNVKDLKKLQERLYAEGKWAVLMVFQAMDAGGKDSAIEHVMSGVNPQGCDVKPFKQPGLIELQHDFLWRHAVELPKRGKIVIFNRSHYEEVLVARVHPEILKAQNIPESLIGDDLWSDRFKDIRAFERHLANSGTVVLKFFLHISHDEQARRFLDRIDQPDKNWKFSASDVAERAFWDDYMAAYEDMIRNTARSYAPWHVIPANDKWFARLTVASVLTETLERLDLQFPEVSEEAKQRMAEAREGLARDAGQS